MLKEKSQLVPVFRAGGDPDIRNQELRRALAKAERALADAMEALQREGRERRMAEESLAMAMIGARNIRWYGQVECTQINSDKTNMTLEWDIYFANEDSIKLWLPIQIGWDEAFLDAWTRAVFEEDRPETARLINNAFLHGHSGYSNEYRMKLADGEVMWLHEEVQVTPVTPNSWYLEGVCTDITGRKRREEQAELKETNSKLAALAFADSLTGLKNHRAFHERLNLEFDRAVRYRTPLSLIMLDVDRFKEYNDAYGHPAGDEVLKRVALILRENAREADFVARYGGEEIAIIVPADSVMSRAIAERLRSALGNAQWPLRPVTASFGVTTFTSVIVHPSTTSLISDADKALYVSKSAGRNCVTHTYDHSGWDCDAGGFAINAGGNTLAQSVFTADSFFTGGSIRAHDAVAETAGILAPMPPGAYRSERYGDFIYRIAKLIPGSFHLVRLHFAEMHWERPGQRLFDVAINGSGELAAYDILARAGGRKRAVVEEFAAIAAPGGDIIIEFSSVADTAKLNALEIVPMHLANNTSINCGAEDAWPFIGDRYHNDAGSANTACTPIAEFDCHEIRAGVPAAIYQSERYGEFRYTIPGIPPGARCVVVLHFCELYWTQAGSRVFDVAINEHPVLTGFDILENSGARFRPVVRTFLATAMEDGGVAIDFVPRANQAQIAAIEVLW